MFRAESDLEVTGRTQKGLRELSEYCSFSVTFHPFVSDGGSVNTTPEPYHGVVHFSCWSGLLNNTKAANHNYVNNPLKIMFNYLAFFFFLVDSLQ